MVRSVNDRQRIEIAAQVSALQIIGEFEINLRLDGT
jgi:hypothetical protein